MSIVLRIVMLGLLVAAAVYGATRAVTDVVGRLHEVVVAEVPPIRAMVYRVAVYDGDVVRRVGAGVMIAPMLMLTAAHVADMPAGHVIYVADNKAPARVLRMDKEKDIALMLVAVGCPCAELALTPPKVDEAVWAVGYPVSGFSGLQIVTQGLMQGIAKADTFVAGHIVTTALLAPGNSGGGLFDHKGRLIGIASKLAYMPVEGSPFGGVTFATHIGAAVSLGDIKTFLAAGTPGELATIESQSTDTWEK